MAIPGLFFVYFRSFQTNINAILQQINVKNVHSNPRPSERESPATRPGLPPANEEFILEWMLIS